MYIGKEYTRDLYFLAGSLEMKTNLRTQKGLNIMMLGGIHKYCKAKSTS